MKIKFITLNIWDGGLLMDNAIEFIKQENPDIIVFQEVNDSKNEAHERRFRSIEEFKKSFPELPYNAFAPTEVDSVNGNIPWGNAVFSKFPILEDRGILFADRLGSYAWATRTDWYNVIQGMIEAKIRVGEKEIYVYSWHGVWGTDGMDNEGRINMAKIIAEEIKDKSSVILAGDTNFTPEAVESIKIIEDAGVKSIFGNTLVSTFNIDRKAGNKEGYAKSAVDMIFVSPDIQVVESRMPQVDASDHYPLVMEFEV